MSWKNLQYKNKSFMYRHLGINTYAYTQHNYCYTSFKTVGIFVVTDIVLDTA